MNELSSSNGIRVPEIHMAADFSLMGCLCPLPDYKSGDWVQYGGMIYKPEGDPVNYPNGAIDFRMAYTVGDYVSGGGRGWPGESSITKHYAHVGYSKDEWISFALNQQGG